MNHRGGTFVFILYICVVVILFGTLTYVVIKKLDRGFSPSLENVEQRMQRKKYDEALRLLAAREKADQEATPRTLCLQGRIWLYKAIQKQDSTHWARYGINESNWLQCREGKRAEQYLTQAIARDDTYGPAHYYLGVLYMQRGWYSEAYTRFERALTLNAHRVYSYINMGVIRSRQEQFRQAKRLLGKAYAIDSANPDVAKNLYFLYSHHTPVPESALIWGNRYLNADPQNDLHEYLIMQEVKKLLARYPDVALSPAPAWRRKGRFDSIPLAR